MRGPLCWLLAVGLVLGSAGLAPAVAAPPKPVAVVSLAGYDEMIGDLNFIGGLADRPQIAAMLEGMVSLATGGRGLDGLDKGRPLGAVIQLDGDELSGYGFLPVTDLKKLMAVVEPLVPKVTDLGEGIYEVRTDQGKDLYVTEKPDGWAVVCDKKESLAAAGDPSDVIGRLGKKYDLAVTFFVQNIPQQYREQFLDQIRREAEQELEKKPDESDAEYAVRKKLQPRLFDAVVAMVNETEVVSLGWSLDHISGGAFLDASIKALPGTACASAMAAAAETKSRFAGLILPDAAVASNTTIRFSKELGADLVALIELIEPELMKDIEHNADSDDAAAVQKQMVGDLLDATKKTVGEGVYDTAGSILFGPRSMTMIGGVYVADGEAVEKVFKQLVEIARKEPGLPVESVQLDAAEVRGVKIHRLAIPDQGPNGEEMAELIGDPAEVAIGIGAKSVYFSFGRNATEVLKTALKDSSDQPQKVAPWKISFSVAPFAQLMSAAGDSEAEREQAARMVEVLEKLSGKDHVMLLVEPIERGLQLRLEVEPDVLKLIGAMAKEEIEKNQN